MRQTHAGNLTKDIISEIDDENASMNTLAMESYTQLPDALSRKPSKDNRPPAHSYHNYGS